MKSSIFIALILLSFSINQPMKTKSVDPFFTLVFKTNDGGVRPDYGNLIKQHLALIGINVDVIIQDWPTFVGEIIAFRDFDLCYLGLTGGGVDPDFTGIYNENGSLNLFGYHTSMDWDAGLGTGINEWYMKQGTFIMPPDSEARVQHYWDWEQYLMDKICPLLPTFTPKRYAAYWSNLNGYNYSHGVMQSWGKMSWSGTHTGQVSTNEIIISDANWTNLNPLFQDDSSSNYISSACMDPLVWFDTDKSVWPHLASSYTMINNTWLRIVVRQGISWGDDPDGLFLSEEFDIYDVYFTLYAWKHVSNDQHLWNWIEDMVILDQWTMDIFIDGDNFTPENEPFAPFLSSLNINILPEHYLNQTQLLDGVTPDITHASWTTFSLNCFGTGLFEISSYTENVETILTVNPSCWWLDGSITTDPSLDWINRFGTFTGGLTTKKIRLIPNIMTIFLEFEAGKVDIIDCTIDSDKRTQYTADPTKSLQFALFSYFSFVGFNMREIRPEMGDRTPCVYDTTISKGLAVRKAINYAIDRVEINNVIHSGEYLINHYPIYTSLGIWCNPNIIRYDFNLTEAKYYMYLAGYEIPGYIPPVFPTPTPPPAITLTAPIDIKIPVYIALIFGSLTSIIVLTKTRRKRGR